MGGGMRRMCAILLWLVCSLLDVVYSYKETIGVNIGKRESRLLRLENMPTLSLADSVNATYSIQKISPDDTHPLVTEIVHQPFELSPEVDTGMITLPPSSLIRSSVCQYPPISASLYNNSLLIVMNEQKIFQAKDVLAECNINGSPTYVDLRTDGRLRLLITYPNNLCLLDLDPNDLSVNLYKNIPFKGVGSEDGRCYLARLYQKERLLTTPEEEVVNFIYCPKQKKYYTMTDSNIPVKDIANLGEPFNTNPPKDLNQVWIYSLFLEEGEGAQGPELRVNLAIILGSASNDGNFRMLYSKASSSSINIVEVTNLKDKLSFAKLNSQMDRIIVDQEKTKIIKLSTTDNFGTVQMFEVMTRSLISSQSSLTSRQVYSLRVKDLNMTFTSFQYTENADLQEMIFIYTQNGKKSKSIVLRDKAMGSFWVQIDKTFALTRLFNRRLIIVCHDSYRITNSPTGMVKVYYNDSLSSKPTSYEHSMQLSNIHAKLDGKLNEGGVVIYIKLHPEPFNTSMTNGNIDFSNHELFNKPFRVYDSSESQNITIPFYSIRGNDLNLFKPMKERDFHHYAIVNPPSPKYCFPFMSRKIEKIIYFDYGLVYQLNSTVYIMTLCAVRSPILGCISCNNTRNFSLGPFERLWKVKYEKKSDLYILTKTSSADLPEITFYLVSSDITMASPRSSYRIPQAAFETLQFEVEVLTGTRQDMESERPHYHLTAYDKDSIGIWSIVGGELQKYRERLLTLPGICPREMYRSESPKKIWMVSRCNNQTTTEVKVWELHRLKGLDWVVGESHPSSYIEGKVSGVCVFPSTLVIVTPSNFYGSYSYSIHESSMEFPVYDPVTTVLDHHCMPDELLFLVRVQTKFADRTMVYIYSMAEDRNITNRLLRSVQVPSRVLYFDAHISDYSNLVMTYYTQTGVMLETIDLEQIYLEIYLAEFAKFGIEVSFGNRHINQNIFLNNIEVTTINSVPVLRKNEAAGIKPIEVRANHPIEDFMIYEGTLDFLQLKPLPNEKEKDADGLKYLDNRVKHVMSREFLNPGQATVLIESVEPTTGKGVIGISVSKGKTSIFLLNDLVQQKGSSHNYIQFNRDAVCYSAKNSSYSISPLNTVEVLFVMCRKGHYSELSILTYSRNKEHPEQADITRIESIAEGVYDGFNAVQGIGANHNSAFYIELRSLKRKKVSIYNMTTFMEDKALQVTSIKPIYTGSDSNHLLSSLCLQEHYSEHILCHR